MSAAPMLISVEETLQGETVPLIPTLISIPGLPLTNCGVACWHTGDNPHGFGLYRDQLMSED